MVVELVEQTSFEVLPETTRYVAYEAGSGHETLSRLYLSFRDRQYEQPDDLILVEQFPSHEAGWDSVLTFVDRSIDGLLTGSSKTGPTDLVYCFRVESPYRLRTEHIPGEYVYSLPFRSCDSLQSFGPENRLLSESNEPIRTANRWERALVERLQARNWIALQAEPFCPGPAETEFSGVVPPSDGLLLDSLYVHLQGGGTMHLDDAQTVSRVTGWEVRSDLPPEKQIKVGICNLGADGPRSILMSWIYDVPVQWAAPQRLYLNTKEGWKFLRATWGICTEEGGLPEGVFTMDVVFTLYPGGSPSRSLQTWPVRLILEGGHLRNVSERFADDYIGAGILGQEWYLRWIIEYGLEYPPARWIEALLLMRGVK